MACPADAAYAWHMRPWAFERLTPAWLDLQVKNSPQSLEKGLKIDLTVRKFGIPVDCRFTVVDLETDKYFADQQFKGPFAFWRHEHRFEAISAELSLMNDDIRYSMPLGSISERFLAAYLEKDLKRLFSYRHEVLKHDLAAYMRNREYPREKIYIYGDFGRLCQPLASYLSTQGHTVLVPLANNPSQAESTQPGYFNGVGAYISVCDSQMDPQAEENIARHAELLAKDLKVYIEVHDAYKGDNSNENFDRRCEPLRAVSVRCVYVRTGAILSPTFGVLKTNSNWNNETQPWIAADDVVSAIEFCMLNEKIEGQIHMSANQKKPPTKEFTTMLATQYPFRYSTLKVARKHVLGL